MSSFSSDSPSPKRHRHRRPTEIGWDTDDDDDLRLRRTDVNHNRPKELLYSEDANPHKMSQRLRALALGRFKILGTGCAGVLLEESSEFKHCVRNARRPPRYYDVPNGFSRSNFPKTMYCSAASRRFPGCGERYHVVWTDSEGDIQVDRMVKLYDMKSVQGYEIDGLSSRPMSLWFGLVNPRFTETPNGKINFDANLFWTVALLFKHFDTCGISLWDRELEELRARFRKALQPPPLFPVPPPPVETPRPLFPAPPPLPVVVHSVPALPPLAPVPVAAHPRQVYRLGERYTGCIVAWMGSYGFLKCTLIPDNVFLHEKDLDGDIRSLSVGTSVNFELAENPAKQGSFKGVNARTFA